MAKNGHELGRYITSADERGNVFRDRNINGDAFFEQRIEVIRQALRH